MVATERFLVTLVALLFAGCSTVNLDSLGTDSDYYFGVVRIEGARSYPTGALRTYSTSGIGLQADSGISLGYFERSGVVSMPDCGVVFLVKNEEQLLTIIQWLRDSGAGRGEGICAAMHSSP